MSRRYVILAPGLFTLRAAKTAHGVIAYSSDATVAVIDPDHSGQTVHDVLPYLQSRAPIVSNLQMALSERPTALLVGVAPNGGALPESWRHEIASALQAGLEVVSGLHDILANDPEFAAAAREGKGKITDLRQPPPVPLFSGTVYDVASKVVLTVGSDCAIGKMTAALELVRAAQERGVNAAFVPTGQTGIAIAGWGIAIDRVISDFASGAAEALVVEASERAELLFVEGQGSINHPAYAGVTLSLLYGCAPDALVLVHKAGQTTIGDFGVPLLELRALIRLYEQLCASVKPAHVVGIILNTHGLDEVAARAAIAEAVVQTGLPVDDVVRFGPLAFYDAIATRVTKGQPLCAEPSVR